MSISNFGELKTAVAGWLNRADLTAQIPDFIRLSEQRIFYGADQPYPSQPLRIPAMQAQATGAIASSSIAFPSRFLEPIRLAGSSGGVQWTFDYITPAAYSARTAATGLPTGYTFLDNAIKTTGTGSASYVLDYYQAFATLTADADTNWLLTNAPGVYLYGALMETSPYIDDARLPQWFAAFKSAVSSVNRATKYLSGGSIVARVTT